MSYGREYDFSRSFFEQWRDFIYELPWPAKSVLNLINSEYSNASSESKNAYLCFDGDYIEDSAYVVDGDTVKDGFDLYESRHSELSYDNYMVDEAFRVFFSINIEESTDIWFSRNLIGCNNCFGCVNLRNKSYYIFNKPYSKEAYKEYFMKFNSGSGTTVTEIKKQAEAFWKTHPMRFALAINNVNSTGEHIEHSKNLKECYTVHDSENLTYSQFIKGPANDSYDYTSWGYTASEMYEAVVCGAECTLMKFSWECWPSSDEVEYSAFCRSSSNLFGCVGLKKKQYCIFNKQYSKEDYHKLREKIVEHMNSMPYVVERKMDNGERRKIEYRYGEFFPPEFSPFAYNETIAQDFFPLTKEQAEAKGYLWREPETKEFKTTVNAADLPDNIKDVTDDILKEVIACEGCGKAYRIIPMELQFYRRIPLPLPRKCPECRFKDRFKFVNPPKFWKGRCMCNGESGKGNGGNEYPNATKHSHGVRPCPNEFETSYAPGRPEIIYCETCYNAEVA